MKASNSISGTAFLISSISDTCNSLARMILFTHKYAPHPSLWSSRGAGRLIRPRNPFKKHPANKSVYCFCPDFMGAGQLQITLYHYQSGDVMHEPSFVVANDLNQEASNRLLFVYYHD